MKQRIRVTQATRPRLLQTIQDLPEGHYVSIQEAKRSLEQNALLWALLTDLSKQVKWSVNGREETLTPEEWKTLMSAAHRKDLRMAPGIDGGLVMLGASTREMSIREMGELVEIIYAFGAEHGVQWKAYESSPSWLQ